ncbi:MULTISPECIES: hypothetical protein [Flavobacterium]|uniref:Uncharacterized protein n=1 Tax=Flavobacterium keumense TaxID=1306518 RepID=A0ABY8N3W2_9FLAO|nr:MULTISPECIES: hypothetical protein [Flavobacterium]WGK93828.1 hypothetical protein MG292_06915 [Flavobacterium keumense]
MKKIKKVIFDDNTELEVDDLKPRSEFESDAKYMRQFEDIEETLLDYISDFRIEHYAEWFLNMVNEDDCECDCDHSDTIDDINDDIVVREAIVRITGAKSLDIISESLIKRFIKIVFIGNKEKIEKYISQKEKELKLNF